MPEKITRNDLTAGRRFAVANQRTAITPTWAVVTVLGVFGDDVHYRYEQSSERRITPIDRFLEIVNSPPNGPHLTPRPITE